MSSIFSSTKKDWILYQSRAATFYQLENWSALYEIERLIRGEGGVYEVVGRFLQLESRFSGRSLDASDVELFFSELHFSGRSGRKVELSLSKGIKGELLIQLRKMNWTHWEITRIARRIARAISLKDTDLIRAQFCELAMLADSPDEITLEDVENFIIGTANPGDGAVPCFQ